MCSVIVVEGGKAVEFSYSVHYEERREVSKEVQPGDDDDLPDVDEEASAVPSRDTREETGEELGEGDAVNAEREGGSGADGVSQLLFCTCVTSRFLDLPFLNVIKCIIHLINFNSGLTNHLKMMWNLVFSRLLRVP